MIGLIWYLLSAEARFVMSAIGACELLSRRGQDVLVVALGHQVHPGTLRRGPNPLTGVHCASQSVIRIEARTSSVSYGRSSMLLVDATVQSSEVSIGPLRTLTESAPIARVGGRG